MESLTHNSTLNGKRILICISSSIAAYKIPDLVSKLKKSGADVQCLLTKNAKHFVSPLVLETMSGRPALDELYGKTVSGTEHIDLARFPDVILVAPASANFIAKLAHGLADDLPSTVILASKAPILVAPAMNTAMFENQATKDNLALLKKRGLQILSPESGLLACGETGEGKMRDTILSDLENYFAKKDLSFEGKTVLITSGPTISALDSVRYMTNPSTGLMGSQLAETLIQLGANVVYISGQDKGVIYPSVTDSLRDKLHIIKVITATQMLETALKFLTDVDGVIAAAAVLDYEFKTTHTEKLKRNTNDQTLELVPSVDVLKGLVQNKKAGQWFLGFAAETGDLKTLGLNKLKKKGVDYLFANPISKSIEFDEQQAGFGSKSNEGYFFFKDGRAIPFSNQSKKETAYSILREIFEHQKNINNERLSENHPKS